MVLCIYAGKLRSSGQFKGNSRARHPKLRFSYDCIYLRDRNGNQDAAGIDESVKCIYR